jgi:hypothetical protein
MCIIGGAEVVDKVHLRIATISYLVKIEYNFMGKNNLFI